MKLYGIKNCDSVKKAVRLLEANGIDFEFFDLKKLVLNRDMVKGWLLKHPEIINKRSTTYRRIKLEIESASDDALIDIIIREPTVLKRPILVLNNKMIIGLDPSYYNEPYTL